MPFRTNASSRPRRHILALALGALAAATSASPASAAHAPPVIQDPADGALLATPQVTVRGAASGDSVAVRLFDGATAVGEAGTVSGSWSVTFAPADGAHTVRARARDAAGAWSALSAPITFTLDTVAPAAPSIASPPDGALLGFSNVTIEGTAEPGARVSLTTDTGGTVQTTAAPTGSWSVARTFADARHTITARATDAAGNPGNPSAAVTFTVDTLAQAQPRITSPAPGAEIGKTAVAIRGTADPGSTVSVSEGSVIGTATAASDGTWSVARTFAEGPHTVEARARDAAGNVSPPSAPVSFRVDLTAPAAPVIASPPEGSYVHGSVTVSGTTEPGATLFLLKGGVVQAVTTAGPAGAWSVALNLENGPHTFEARAEDRAGNLSALSPVRRFTTDSTPPTAYFTTPPGAILSPATSTRLEGIAADDSGVAAVELEYYDLLGKAVARIYATCFGCPALEAMFRSDYSPGPGRYTVKGYAIDRAGNRSGPAVITFVRL